MGLESPFDTQHNPWRYFMGLGNRFYVDSTVTLLLQIQRQLWWLRKALAYNTRRAALRPLFIMRSRLHSAAQSRLEETHAHKPRCTLLAFVVYSHTVLSG